MPVSLNGVVVLFTTVSELATYRCLAIAIPTGIPALLNVILVLAAKVLAKEDPTEFGTNPAPALPFELIADVVDVAVADEAATTVTILDFTRKSSSCGCGCCDWKDVVTALPAKFEGDDESPLLLHKLLVVISAT